MTDAQTFPMARRHMIILAAVSPLIATAGFVVTQVVTDFTMRYALGAYVSGWFLLISFGLLFIWQVLHLTTLPSAPLRIDTDGITDRRVSSRLIPWSQISNVAKKGSYVCLTLRRKFASDFQLPMLARIDKLRRKDVGPSHVLLAVSYLRVSRDDLFNVISKARAQA